MSTSSGTKFPAASEYQAALQNPGFCFRDALLRSATPERTPLGLPRPLSGNFASVFPVWAGDGTRYAVKCFTRPAHDQLYRYRTIADELNRVHPHWAAPMRFHREGILVGGTWYPLLVMDWVEAAPLTQWIDRNIQTPSRIARVAERFADVVQEIEARDMAHGDLQHGNVLVDQADGIRLVDYDGMYLHGLDGHPPGEVGHPNYQHPDRAARDYGPAMDRFSASLIVLSLRALATAPDLWDECNPGHEEYLLLQKDDLADPVSSARVSLLRDHTANEVSHLAHWLFSARGADPARLPALAESLALTATTSSPNRPTGPAPASPTGASESMPAWLSGRLAATATTAPESAPDPSSVDPSPAPPDFSPRRPVWLMLGAVLSVVVAVAVPALVPAAFRVTALFAAVAVESVLLVALVAGAVRAHRTTELYQAASAVRRQRSSAKRDLDASQRRSRRAASRRDTVVRQIDKVGSRDTRELRDLERRHEAKRANRQKDRDRLDTQARALPQEEQAELDQLLEQRRQEHISTWMRSARIADHRIPAIGADLVGTLHAYGFVAAADLTDAYFETAWYYNRRYYRAYLLRWDGQWVHVPGIGEVRANNLLQWRHRQYEMAEASVPWQLGPADRDQIRSHYARRERELADQIRELTDKLSDLETAHTREVDELKARQRARKQSELASLTARRDARDDERKAAERAIAQARQEIRTTDDWLAQQPGSGFLRYLRMVVFPP